MNVSRIAGRTSEEVVPFATRRTSRRVALAGWALALLVLAPSVQAQESPTRRLRRVALQLLERTPTPAEYEALIASADPDAEIRRFVDEALSTEAFHRLVLDWGHEYLRTSSYRPRSEGPHYGGSHSRDLRRCASGTLHEGALGFLNTYPHLGDPPSICNLESATVRDIEPWWAPGTTIRVIGSAGSDVREVDGVDCAPSGPALYENNRPAEGCSCGPHLIYCARAHTSHEGPLSHINGWDGDDWNESAQSRSVYDEPARLFAHIIENDRPFSDLVAGTYTVVNQGVHHLYVRLGRNNAENRFLDEIEWWRDYPDRETWREVRFSEMHPNLLDDRGYRFDPRVEDGAPRGIPSAGVLSTIAFNYSFPRERVRAARALEIFACREFSPPPPGVVFNEYRRDPGREGGCQHCHQAIDPAAIHFKRPFGVGGTIAGVGRWSLDRASERSSLRVRAEAAFLADTRMTPVSAERIAAAPDARFIDFLPPSDPMFGVASDGTIGPLGFAKILLASGEFDRCAVRHVHQRFGGRDLVPGRDERQLQTLVARFVEGDRNVRNLIAHILTEPDPRRR
ncbi:MAG: hypothetical protein AAGE52_33920 [Myxococcota bacterium]